jgi:hypothetical protein
MAECQSSRMKGLSRGDPLQLFGDPSGPAGDPAAPTPAVHGITHDRVADMLQMHSDLVGPSGMELESEQISYLEAGDDEGIGPRRAAPGRDCHPFPVLGVPRKGRINPGWARVQMSPHQGSVRPLHSLGCDGGAQLSVGEIRLGHDHQARRIAIEAMHDAGSSLRAAGEGRASGNERIHQRVVPMPRRRVHNQSGRLVDHSEMLVLVNEDERDGCWLDGSGRFLLWKPDGDALATGQHSRGASHLAVDRHQLTGN